MVEALLPSKYEEFLVVEKKLVMPLLGNSSPPLDPNLACLGYQVERVDGQCLKVEYGL